MSMDLKYANNLIGAIVANVNNLLIIALLLARLSRGDAIATKPWEAGAESRRRPVGVQPNSQSWLTAAFGHTHPAAAQSGH